MKKVLVFLLAIGLTSFSYGEKIYREVTVLFETDSHNLENAARIKIDSFLQTIDLHTDYQITVSGHTDKRASDDYNQALSKRRTDEVKTYLTSVGINYNNLSASFHGEKQPVKYSDSQEDLALNRRVEIRYTTYLFADENEFLDSLKTLSSNRFLIDPTIDNRLTGKKGVELFIPANCLQNRHDNSFHSDSVVVQLDEALDYTAYIAHDLLTVSNDRFLESDGMFFFTAETKAGELLSIDKENPVEARLPADKSFDDMLVFRSASGQNWNTEEEKVRYSARELMNSLQVKVSPRPTLNSFVISGYAIDESTRPLIPGYPVEPRPPHLPRPESYEPTLRLTDIGQHKKLQNQAERRYERALEDFDERMVRYEEAMVNYRIAVEAYPEKYRLYELALREWNLNNEKRVQEYYIQQRNDRRRYELFSQQKYEKERIDWIELNRKRRDSLASLLDERLEADHDSIKDDPTKNRIYSMGMNQAVMEIIDMGWNNCDRFYLNSNQRQIAINKPMTDKRAVSLLFPEINARLPMNFYDEQFVKRIPQDERALAFTFKIENGKPAIYLEEMIAGQDEFDVVFKQTSFSAFNKTLKNLRQGDELNIGMR